MPSMKAGLGCWPYFDSKRIVFLLQEKTGGNVSTRTIVAPAAIVTTILCGENQKKKNTRKTQSKEQRPTLFSLTIPLLIHLPFLTPQLS